MKRLALILFSGVVLIAVAGFLFLNLYPGKVLTALQTLSAWNSGFVDKSFELDGYTANYYEAGPENGPVVVLLHGLIDDRNSFVSAAQGLAEHFRVILPDLQGHGDNAQASGRDYSIQGQVIFIAELLQALEVKELSIGGNSMGGHVAAAFALSHQDKVQSLMLLNATGMLLDAPPTYSAYPEGIDAAYLEEMYANVFIEPPSIPGPIMGYLAVKLNQSTPFYNALIEQVVGGNDFRLDERIKALSTPTLVIWGTEDRLVPIHYAKAYDAALPNSDLLILEAGHAPQVEIAGEVAKALNSFLSLH